MNGEDGMFDLHTASAQRLQPEPRSNPTLPTEVQNVDLPLLRDNQSTELDGQNRRGYLRIHGTRTTGMVLRYNHISSEIAHTLADLVRVAVSLGEIFSPAEVSHNMFKVCVAAGATQKWKIAYSRANFFDGEAIVVENKYLGVWLRIHGKDRKAIRAASKYLLHYKVPKQERKGYQLAAPLSAR